MLIEHILLISSMLILISITVSKVSDNLGVPSLLLFLSVGLMAGSEGPGGIYFNDAHFAQSVGILALIYILFDGGLDTQWREVRTAVKPASSLATLGVFITACTLGIFAAWLLNISLLTGMLLGAVVSSTDAAAVFSVLRSKKISLQGRLKPLLELESGSNDPMAVFLTIGLIQLIMIPETSILSILLLFFRQMLLGGALGFALGKALVVALNRLKLSYEGLYSVFVLAFAALVYGVTASVGGSGFLAVYVAGVVVGNSGFIQKRTILRFFDGLAWLCQIGMFLTLGLLVFPSKIIPVAGFGLITAFFLMFVARPISVFLSLALSDFNWREKTFISWVGLRGAVPVILATFPLLAGVPGAEIIFNVVFFIVVTSVLIQGWTLTPVAKLLKLDRAFSPKRRYPIEFSPLEGVDTELIDLIVPYNCAMIGRSIVELDLPVGSLVVLISREDDFIVPTGRTIIEESDSILVLVNKKNLTALRALFEKKKELEM
jgi:potassium/hydrogen antiporter